MRIAAALWMAGLVAASAAVSVVAFAQGSTWGGGSSPVAVDAGAPAVPEVHSTWGSAAAAPFDAGAPAAVPAPPSADAGPPVRPLPPRPAPSSADADAGAEPDAAASTGIAPPSDVGFSVGIRGGYSVPMGTANVSSLGSVVQGVAPIGADMGWFLTPHLYIGAYFLYGFGVNAGVNNDTCGDPDTECNATLYRFGAVTRWHFRPAKDLDPWVGLGLGYEILAVEADSDVDGSTVSAATLQGLDVTLEAGLDFKPLPYVGLGPYFELATGQYFDVESFSPHAWATFGLRLRTNL